MPNKKVGKYEIHKTLGEGTFGKVKRALNSETKEWVAIKVLDKEKIQRQNMGAQVKKEISIMKMIRHPHVVQLKEVLASRTKIFIVLEIVTGGELFDKIVADGRFNEKVARFYFQQLCVGTEYCHRQGVCHRDLKPENLLLDDQGNLKISDFGLSALYEQGSDSDRQLLLHTTCGTPNYVAPEVLADKGYDGTIADTWSIGVILYVFLAGFLPFDEPTMATLFRKIQKADFSYPSWFTEEIKDLLGHILVVDPQSRWTIQQIMQHSWWKKNGPYADCADVNETALKDDVALGNVNVVSPPNPPSSKMEVESQSSHEELGELNESEQVQSQVSATSSQISQTFPKRVNAFDLINMCSGSAINRMLQNNEDKNQRRLLMFTAPNTPAELLEIIKTEFQSIPGFIEQKTYKNDSKLRAAFDFGKGQVHTKATIKIASEDPMLCIVIFKRARGDLISFNSNIAPRLNDMAKSFESPGQVSSRSLAGSNK